MRRRIANPQVWGWGLFALLALFLYSLMGDYGLSWDEPTRWNSGDVKLDYYQQLWEADNKWDTMQDVAPSDVYPGLYDIPLAVARHSLDIEPVLLSRIWNVTFGLLAILGCRALALQVHGKRGEGRKLTLFDFTSSLIAPVSLLLIPEFFGHIFINPKDIPFAATYVWGVYALVRVLQELPNPTWKSALRFGVLAGLCMSTRPPGVVLFGYVALGYIVYLLIESQARGRQIWSVIYKGVASFGLSILVLVPFWPASHRNPFSSSVLAVEKLVTVSKSIPLLFQGQVYSAGESPFYYAIWMFAIKMPLWYLILLVAAPFFLLLEYKERKVTFLSARKELVVRGSVLVSACFPMVYVLVKQPAIHNGFRHLLYLLPVSSVIVGWVWVACYKRLKENVLYLRLFLGASLICGAMSVSTLARLHPYQYLYYNSLAGGPQGALNHYETEYWFTSGRESVAKLKAWLEGRGVVPESVPLKVMVSGPWQAIEPYLPEEWTLVGNAGEADVFIGNTQMRSDLLVEGEEIISIERMGLPIVIIKSLRK